MSTVNNVQLRLIVKLWRFLLVLASLLFLSSNQNQVKIIRMGYFNLPPHQYNQGKSTVPSGAAVFYFEKIADEMGYDVQWVGQVKVRGKTKEVAVYKVGRS